MRAIFVVLSLGVIVALAVGAVAAINAIGGERLYTLALVLVGAMGTAMVMGSLALVVFAWRRNQQPEREIRHIIRETKLIDGRPQAAPQVQLLPAPQQHPLGVFPELLRAAYQAGANERLSSPPGRQGMPLGDELIDGDVTTWGGSINP